MTLKTKEEELKKEKEKDITVSALCCLLCFSLYSFIKKQQTEFFSLINPCQFLGLEKGGQAVATI